MVERIKMPLDKEVGLGPDHIVLDGDPVGTSAPTASPPHFLARLLWPDGRPSQQLLSSYYNNLWQILSTNYLPI